MRPAVSIAVAILVAAAANAGPARSLTPGMPASCIGCSFAGRDLHGADLSGGSYIGSDFARTNLRGATLP